MIKKAIILSGILIFLFSLILILDIALPRDQDKKEYQKFLSQSKKKQKDLSQPIYQTKSTKEIWYSKDNDRFKIQIESDKSDLMIQINKNKLEMIEELKGISCQMEDSQNGTKSLRKFSADYGIYNYNTNNFITNNAIIEFYNNCNSNTDLPACINGTANQISINFSEKSPVFNAKHFKAKITP